MVPFRGFLVRLTAILAVQAAVTPLAAPLADRWRIAGRAKTDWPRPPWKGNGKAPGGPGPGSGPLPVNGPNDINSPLTPDFSELANPSLTDSFGNEQYQQCFQAAYGVSQARKYAWSDTSPATSVCSDNLNNMVFRAAKCAFRLKKSIPGGSSAKKVLQGLWKGLANFCHNNGAPLKWAMEQFEVAARSLNEAEWLEFHKKLRPPKPDFPATGEAVAEFQSVRFLGDYIHANVLMFGGDRTLQLVVQDSIGEAGLGIPQHEWNTLSQGARETAMKKLIEQVATNTNGVLLDIARKKLLHSKLADPTVSTEVLAHQTYEVIQSFAEAGSPNIPICMTPEMWQDAMQLAFAPEKDFYLKYPDVTPKFQLWNPEGSFTVPLKTLPTIPGEWNTWHPPIDALEGKDPDAIMDQQWRIVRDKYKPAKNKWLDRSKPEPDLSIKEIRDQVLRDFVQDLYPKYLFRVTERGTEARQMIVDNLLKILDRQGTTISNLKDIENVFGSLSDLDPWFLARRLGLGSMRKFPEFRGIPKTLAWHFNPFAKVFFSLMAGAIIYVLADQSRDKEEKKEKKDPKEGMQKDRNGPNKDDSEKDPEQGMQKDKNESSQGEEARRVIAQMVDHPGEVFAALDKQVTSPAWQESFSYTTALVAAGVPLTKALENYTEPFPTLFKEVYGQPELLKLATSKLFLVSSAGIYLQELGPEVADKVGELANIITGKDVNSSDLEWGDPLRAMTYRLLLGQHVTSIVTHAMMSRGANETISVAGDPTLRELAEGLGIKEDGNLLAMASPEYREIYQQVQQDMASRLGDRAVQEKLNEIILLHRKGLAGPIFEFDIKDHFGELRGINGTAPGTNATQPSNDAVPIGDDRPSDITVPDTETTYPIHDPLLPGSGDNTRPSNNTDISLHQPLWPGNVTASNPLNHPPSLNDTSRVLVRPNGTSEVHTVVCLLMPSTSEGNVPNGDYTTIPHGGDIATYPKNTTAQWCGAGLAYLTTTLLKSRYQTDAIQYVPLMPGGADLLVSPNLTSEVPAYVRLESVRTGVVHREPWHGQGLAYLPNNWLNNMTGIPTAKGPSPTRLAGTGTAVVPFAPGSTGNVTAPCAPGITWSATAPRIPSPRTTGTTWSATAPWANGTAGITTAPRVTGATGIHAPSSDPNGTRKYWPGGYMVPRVRHHL